MEAKKRRKYFGVTKLVVGLVGAATIMIVAVILNSAGFKRWWKSVSSDFGNGINRTITVYDYNGKEIKSWTGKFDIDSSENKTLFDDENGKRVTIHGGIVISEEN